MGKIFYTKYYKNVAATLFSTFLARNIASSRGLIRHE
jgi:hypothetical protein